MTSVLLVLFAMCVVMLLTRGRCIFGRGGSQEVGKLCVECSILKVVVSFGYVGLVFRRENRS